MKTNVSLVLSGGGARGIAHIGVIEEIIQRGYKISSIAGTSMGALVGGIFALGKLTEFKEWLYKLDKIKVFSLVDFTFSTQGLIKGDKVFNALKEFIQDKNIEDLDINYSATAADITNKKEVVFTSGSVFKAIRASIAIPSVFTPVKTNNGLLVDGGVLNNIPIKNVKRIENDLLIVVDVNANIPIYKPSQIQKGEEHKKHAYVQKIKEFSEHLHNILPTKNTKDNLSYFNLIDKTISLMMYQMSQRSLKEYSPEIVVEISRDTCSTFDFYKAEELVEMGRYAAQNNLNKLEI